MLFTTLVLTLAKKKPDVNVRFKMLFIVCKKDCRAGMFFSFRENV